MLKLLANSLMMFIIMIGLRWENKGRMFCMKIASERQKILENLVPKCKNNVYCSVTIPGFAAKQTSFHPCVNLPFPAHASFFWSDQELSEQELSVAVCLYNTSYNENSFLVQAVPISQ